MAIAECSSRTKRDAATVQRALRIIEQQLGEYGPQLSSPGAVKDYLRLRLAREKREVFMCLFLTAQNRLIEAREMFAGTLTQTSVYPREVARVALELNAACLILAHNHPSGEARPSVADRALTQALAAALSVFDIGVLDHLIVGREAVLSFSEQGIRDGLRQDTGPIHKRIAPVKQAANGAK
jgi:DNA repair protein RadC